MHRQFCAALLAAFAFAAAAHAQDYDLFIIEDAAFGATIQAVASPNARWAGVRTDTAGTDFLQGSVLDAAPEDSGDDALTFVSVDDGADLAQAEDDARTYVRISGASAAEARDFIADIDGASLPLRQRMRSALGL